MRQREEDKVRAQACFIYLPPEPIPVLFLDAALVGLLSIVFVSTVILQHILVLKP